jgi:uncharacterized membrane protein YbaN (DUF454 family)
MSSPSTPRKISSKPVRILLIAAGSMAVALAIIGILVPVLPTTVFLLLAAAAFARSSERFYTWLITNKVFGSYILNYRLGLGIRLRHKLVTMILLWSMIGISGYFFVDLWWVKLILLAVAFGVSTHILTVKTTLEPKKPPLTSLASQAEYDEI